MIAPLKASQTSQSIPAALVEVAHRYPQRGIHAYDPQAVKAFMSYPQLLDGALRVSGGLRRQGVPPAARVLMVAEGDLDFVQVFLGAQFAGLVPIPVGPPRGGLDRQHGGFVASLQRLASRLGARHVVVPGNLNASLRTAASRAFARVWNAQKLVGQIEAPVNRAEALVQALGPDDVAYVQLSSGATGPSRGALLTHGNLLTNIRAIGKRLGLTEDDVGVSWLPLFHDMGLVGALLFSLVWGLPLVQLHPERFLQMPHEWLWAFPNHKATLSLAPDLGYHYCSRRARRSDLEGLDLSSWRIAITGGEPVHLHHVETFARRFKPYGLRPSIMVPVYGLGEATLAVSVADVVGDGAPGVEVLDRDALEYRRLAVKTATQEPSDMVVVHGGRVLEGLTVEIRKRNTGQLCQDGELGELLIRGPSIMQGYCGPAAPNLAPARGGLGDDGWLATGDLGYRRGADLFVVGRAQDAIHLAHGRQFHPDPVEAMLARIDGVRPGAVALFGVPLEAAQGHRDPALQQMAADAIAAGRIAPSHTGAELLIVAIETIEGLDVERLTQAIEETLLERAKVAADDLQLLAPQSIPRTRSGKVQRYKCRRFYLEGILDRRTRQQRWNTLSAITERARTTLALFGRNIRKLFDDDDHNNTPSS
ncbi:MAG: AMP-binding protein [Myxococcota bacterium]